MKDFFVSYTGFDSAFATWVAEVLESNQYSVTIQAWDFKPGDNFVSKINEALMECEKLIVILSESYLKSKWCEAEWTAKLTEQIKLSDNRIIPIRIEPVEIRGLLAPIVFIDIVDASEDEAKERILNGINNIELRKSKGYPSFYNAEHFNLDIDYYVEESRIIYFKSCKTRILVDGKNKIHQRLTWFADEEIHLSSLTEGVSIELLDLHDTNFNYNIVFERELKKLEVVEYRIKAVVSNNNRHFSNFFSTEVITPMENLNVHLNIPDLAVKKVYTQKISNSPMNRRTEQPKEHIFISPYHWHIPTPELNFEYKIFW